jgi:hypothetical protein
MGKVTMIYKENKNRKREVGNGERRKMIEVSENSHYNFVTQELRT